MHMTRVSILLITVALIVGLVGCAPVTTQYNLTISSTEGGSVTTPGKAIFTYEQGTIVDLVAVADEGYVFYGWTGDAGTIADVENATTNITMNADYIITANFETIQASIDNVFLDEVNTTYYGNWMLSKEDVRELEGMRVEAGLSEVDMIELLVGICRECTNWVDLYTINRFDCSEMSALFECMMEQTGYPTCIAASLGYRHAWCLVKTEERDEGYLPVECTGMFIPWEGSSGLTWDEYFDYEELFETIYQGEEWFPEQFDWWNSVQVEELTFDEVKMDKFISEWLEEHVSQEVIVADETKYLEYGQYWYVSTELEEGYEIEVTVEVKQGGPIDVLLFNSGQYLRFEQFMEGNGTTLEYFVTGSALNVMSKSYTFQIPSSDRYYVVISNAGGIEGGATPEGDVAVYLKVVAIVHP
jgi:uncharacterized repeat protein (TIGR02543 family)